MKRIKNTQESNIIRCGQTLEQNIYYTIELAELFKWQNDSDVLADLASGLLVINDGDNDIVDTADAINFLKDTDATPRDSDGSPLSRIKVTQSGWHYQLHGMEFTSSKLNSVYAKDVDGNDLSFLSAKFYDINNNELTDQTDCNNNCVKTVVDWEPNYDYEIIGGFFKLKSIPTSDVRLWVIGVPDVPAGSGGSKVFASNVNLRYIGIEEGIKIDGRAPKYLSYNNTYHTNKMRFILKHNAGLQHDFHIVMEIFKP